MTIRLVWPLLCVALALGEGLGLLAGPFSSFWPLAALAAVVVILLGYGLSLRGWWLVALVLAGFVAGAVTVERQRQFLSAARSARGPLELTLTAGEPVTVRTDAEGVVWASFAATVAGVRIRPVFALPADEPPPRVGDTWRVAGWLARGKPEAGRPRTLWVRGGDTFAERIRRGEGTFAGVLAAVRGDFSRRAGLGLDHAPEIADLNRAILLGERARMDRATKRTFVDAGTVHVFAISGLHVMALAVALQFLLVVCFVPLRFAGLVATVPLWLYVFLVGAPSSAVRAAAMATVAFAAPVFWRRPDALVAWSVTFLATHLIAPENLFDVGSALSFAVMFGLLLWGEWCAWSGVMRFEKAGYAFAAWAAGVPIAALAFGRFTPAGLLSNIVLIPTASVSVMASAAGIATSYVSEWVAAHINNAAYLFTSAMVGLSRAVASLPGASFEIAPWSPAICLAWYAVLGLGAWLAGSVIRRRRRTI